MSTKDFSSIQENMIANYLGWDVVSGSGAAACVPGDVIGDEWLGECKTHMKPTHRIFFSKSVWLKICEEAVFKHRNPILFADDGCQNHKTTWCLFKYDQLDLDSCICIDSSKISKRTNITFNDIQVMTEIVESRRSTNFEKIPAVLVDWFDGRSESKVVIMTLEMFKDMISS